MNAIEYIMSDWKWLSIMLGVNLFLFTLGLVFMRTLWVPLITCIIVLFFNLWWAFYGGKWV